MQPDYTKEFIMRFLRWFASRPWPGAWRLAPSRGRQAAQRVTRALLVERLEARALLSFLPAVNYGAGDSPFSVAVGDFRHNGVLDLAVANSGSGTVSVLLGYGDGTFQTAVNYAVGGDPFSVVVGDFDGDGSLDLAVSKILGHNVSVLLGNGDGTFRPAVNYAVGFELHGLAVGNFRDNGILDLAVADRNGLYVLLGNGDGTFQTGVFYAAGAYSQSVAAGDFDGDGTLDLVVANFASHDVSVLLGNGDGTFRPAVSYAAGSNPQSVAVGDFNGDGTPDLAVAGGDSGAGSLSVLLGNGDGTFQAAVHYDGGIGPDRVTVGDFNADGVPDLAVANLYGNHVSVLLGNGDGTFQAPDSYRAGSGPFFAAVGDFNGDGWPDLAVANAGSNDVSILLNDTNWPGGGAPGREAGQGLPRHAVTSLSVLATSRTASAPAQPNSIAQSDEPRPERWASPRLVDALFAAPTPQEPDRAVGEANLVRHEPLSAGPRQYPVVLLDGKLATPAWDQL
jgi:hypothetical protein